MVVVVSVVNATWVVARNRAGKRFSLVLAARVFEGLILLIDLR